MRNAAQYLLTSSGWGAFAKFRRQSCYGILVPELLLRNSCYEILVTEFLFRNYCYGILVTESWISVEFCKNSVKTQLGIVLDFFTGIRKSIRRFALEFCKHFAKFCNPRTAWFRRNLCHLEFHEIWTSVNPFHGINVVLLVWAIQPLLFVKKTQ